jgi:hypothetical protein
MGRDIRPLHHTLKWRNTQMSINNANQKSTAQKSSSDENNSYFNRARNRAVLFHRSREGVLRIFRNPLKSIPIILLTIVFAYALYMTNIYYAATITENQRLLSMFSIFDRVFDYAVTPILLLVIRYLYMGGVALFFLLLLLGTLSWLSHPPKMRKIEQDVISMFGLTQGEHRYKRPFLIKVEEESNSIREYFFFSRWIPDSSWRNLDIRDSLNNALECDFVEGVNRQKNKDIVVLRVE